MFFDELIFFFFLSKIERFIEVDFFLSKIERFIEEKTSKFKHYIQKSLRPPNNNKEGFRAQKKKRKEKDIAQGSQKL